MSTKTKKRKPRAAKEPQTVIVRHLLRAKYDAAQTTDDNRRHWANADSLSATAALLPDVRRRLRDRCRYEVANNSYAKGIGLTIANDTVNIGPALKLLMGDKPQKKQFETLFWNWTQAIRLPEKLRLMRFARYDSGEAFAVFVNNPSVPGPVKLDVQLIESEQIADPWTVASDRMTDQSDGIDYDSFGNPLFYRKLARHPGGTDSFALSTDFEDIPARFVFHYLHPDRPGQRRGIPDIQPAISAFADLRRFCDASIAAAETAADHAAVVKTTAPPDTEGAQQQQGDTPATWDLVQLEKRGGLVLPENWDIAQLKAEHPINTYKDFVNAKLNEIARCLCVPFHIAAMDPSIANMSSSYVVGQMYAQERLVDRAELERMLEMALAMYVEEISKQPEFQPILPENDAHIWFWPSLGHHADPQKVANAAATRLANGLGSIPHEFAMLGLDSEEQQISAAESLGMTLQEYRKRVADKIFGPDPAENVQKPAQNSGNSPQDTQNEDQTANSNA